MNHVELHLLKSHRLNPNRLTGESFDKLVASMRHFGLCTPIIIRPHPKKPGQFITIDGHHRIQAAKLLDWKTIPCQVWNISAKDARLALATLNRLRGTDIPQKRAELLSSLTQAFSIQDLAQLIPESEAQIQDMLQLLQTDFDALEKAIKSEIEREQEQLPVPYTFLVSPDNQSTVDDALKAFGQEVKDRGEAFVQICTSALAGLHGKP